MCAFNFKATRKAKLLCQFNPPVLKFLPCNFLRICKNLHLSLAHRLVIAQYWQDFNISNYCKLHTHGDYFFSNNLKKKFHISRLILNIKKIFFLKEFDLEWRKAGQGTWCCDVKKKKVLTLLSVESIYDRDVLIHKKPRENCVFIFEKKSIAK